MARSTAYKPSSRAVADLATERLAAYAAAAKYDHFPQAAAERAKRCLVDAVACAIFGAQFPWSTMVLDEALATGAGGDETLVYMRSSVRGRAEPRMRPAPSPEGRGVG